MSGEPPPDPLELDNLDASPKPTVPETWQKRWRIAGGVTIAICAIMAGFGANMELLRSSRTLFLVYWGVFALSFFATLYIVALDLRYIRAQHAIAERDLFRETLGEREFREALREAVKSKSDPPSDDANQ